MCEELRIALSMLRKGKAGGNTGILSKLLVCGGKMHDRPLKLMQEVWEEGSVVADWKDAEISAHSQEWQPEAV